MRIVIRADASVAIGTGHVMRCLTLARTLQEQGALVTFICRDLPGNSCQFIAEQGFDLRQISGDDAGGAARDAAETIEELGERPTWLIVDNYGLDREWESTLRPHVGRVMIIDDLADRHHDCDLLLDQNLFDNMAGRYTQLVPPGCRQLLGPRYALLRDEFISARRSVRERDGMVRRMLFFFGGSDPTNETEKALAAIALLNRRDVAVDVVVGGANPLGDRIKDACASLPQVVFHRQITTMADLIVRADLAVGAGGTTTWERCFLGLPTLTIIVADNQAEPARAAHNAGLARLVGESRQVSSASLAVAIEAALQSPGELAAMSRRCLEFMGRRTSPVPEELMTILCEVPHAA